ncbi:MAG: hypothetical protein KIT31_16335 [Deltaproteobacteria bacterium]|nr:hypothetical protein [Deltaproteobacteria bacterium]
MVKSLAYFVVIALAACGSKGDDAKDEKRQDKRERPKMDSPSGRESYADDLAATLAKHNVTGVELRAAGLDNRVLVVVASKCNAARLEGLLEDEFDNGALLRVAGFQSIRCGDAGAELAVGSSDKKEKRPNEALVRFVGHVDKICACADGDCITKQTEAYGKEMTEWVRGQPGERLPEPTEAAKRAIEREAERMTGCTEKIVRSAQNDMDAMADKLCACRDTECARAAMDEAVKLSEQNAGRQVTKATAERYERAQTRILACMEALAKKK